VPVQLALPRGCSPVSSWAGEAHVSIESTMSSLTVSDIPVVMMQPGEWMPAEGSERVQLVIEGPTELLRKVRTDRLVATVELPDAPQGDELVAVFQGREAPRVDVLLPYPEDLRVVGEIPNVKVVRQP